MAFKPYATTYNAPLCVRLRSGFATGTEMSQAADEIERLRKALEEIADPDNALLAYTKAEIARKALGR